MELKFQLFKHYFNILQQREIVYSPFQDTLNENWITCGILAVSRDSASS